MSVFFGYQMYLRIGLYTDDRLAVVYSGENATL